MNRLKSKIKIISTGGITTGNFLKGIKENRKLESNNHLFLSNIP